MNSAGSSKRLISDRGKEATIVKAIQVSQTGGPEVLRYVDAVDPRPGAGEALVDIKAVGVNFTDVYTRSGLNPPPSLPAMGWHSNSS